MSVLAYFKNQKLPIFFTGVLILLVGIFIGYGLGKDCAAPLVQILPSENKCESQDFVGEYKVARVIDGDTIEIEGGERVRYIGIDSPETMEPGKAMECFGPEATAKNKELVAGQTVRLEKDTTDRDKYNRLLRYVWVGDNFINLELVKQGFARSSAYPPDIRYQAQFLEAQRQAEKAKSGLWTACP